MSIDLTVIDFQRAQDELQQALAKFRGGKVVTVGIHEEAGDIEDGTLTMASLGATLHFGAEIDHPGGTDYGYASAAAAERGDVRFMRKGAGFMSLGVTGPHKVILPARPWLDVGVASATKEIVETIRDGAEDGLTLDQTLQAVGAVAAAGVRQYMTDLKTPPNAASTIKKKKSANPLIDNGHLRSSVTFAVTAEPQQEGLQ